MRLRVLLVGALVFAACGDDEESSSNPMDASIPLDSTVPTPADAGIDAAIDATVTAPPDCFTNPKTYLEIINACTDAEKVTKNPTLPLLGADGKLPPLP